MSLEGYRMNAPSGPSPRRSPTGLCLDTPARCRRTFRGGAASHRRHDGDRVGRHPCARERAESSIRRVHIPHLEERPPVTSASGPIPLPTGEGETPHGCCRTPGRRWSAGCAPKALRRKHLLPSSRVLPTEAGDAPDDGKRPSTDIRAGAGGATAGGPPWPSRVSSPLHQRRRGVGPASRQRNERPRHPFSRAPSAAKAWTVHRQRHRNGEERNVAGAQRGACR